MKPKLEPGLRTPREMKMNEKDCVAMQWQGDNLEEGRKFLQEAGILLDAVGEKLIIEEKRNPLHGWWLAPGALLCLWPDGNFSVAVLQPEQMVARN